MTTDRRARQVAHDKAKQAGFTLVEILVVLAITAILLTLVVKPLIDGFNLTSRSGTQIQSQTAAREVTREITTALSNATFVFDNSQVASALNLWFTDSAANPFFTASQFTMLEYVAPAHQLDQNPQSLSIDPTTGLPIYPPTLPPSETGYALPLAPGRALNRIWIGLRDNTPQPSSVAGASWMPAKPYVDGYEDPQLAGATNDNRYMLWHAEVLAYIPDPDNPATYIPNLSLFHTMNSAGMITDSKTDTLVLHDANFWYDGGLAGDATSKGAMKWAVPGWKDLKGDGKVYIWENWRALATAMFRTDKADLVTLDRDDNNRIIYDAVTKHPTVRPLALFAPSFVDNDHGNPTSLGNAANEDPSAAAPSYTSQYAHWDGDPNLIPYHVFVYRSPNPAQDPLTLNPLDFFEGTPDGRIVEPTGIGPGQNPPNPGTLTDVGPNIDPVSGVFRNTSPAFAFTIDPLRGIVNFSFPASVLVHDAGNQPLPSVYSPADINDALDPNNTDGINGQWQRRYLDLHVLPATALAPPWAGTALNPASALSPLTQMTGNVHIVPGSERVFGPDQRPGPHYGYRVQYTRISSNAGALGPNEYRVNYDDVPNAGAAQPGDPRVRIGYVEFDSQPDSTIRPNIADDPAANPPIYKPHGLPSYKSVFNGTSYVDALSDAVEVTYNFQMNLPNDVVKMDYLTRDLMNVTLQARFYDPPTATPQVATLTTRVKVRNLQR